MTSEVEDYINILKNRLFKDFDMLSKSGNYLNNKKLSECFETYSCIQLIQKYNKLFHQYKDIPSDFKEENQMTQNDTGIDICDMKDTIVQSKMYSKNTSLRWEKLSTFFGSQNISNQEGETIIRWRKMIITRLDESHFSSNMKTRMKLFQDITYNREEFIEYLQNTLINPPIIPNKIKKRNPHPYQIHCKKLIQENEKNIILNIPTGGGKNYIATISLLPNKKYLFLVPRKFLLHQIKDDINSEHPRFTVQILGDGNTKFSEDIDITICVYNSIDKIKCTFDKFKKIFIDEGHHIYPPQIYNIQNEISDNDEEKDNDEDEIPKTFIDKIRDLKIYNNNVLLSATIDKHPDYPIFFSKNIRDMINEGFLCDYNLTIPVFTHDDITMEERAHYIIDKHHEIIIFCKSQKDGKKLTEVMNTYMKNCAKYIDCNTSKKDRQFITTQFKNGKLPFIVNVNILTESFDSPNCKGVCFFSLPSSKTKTLQIIGRALRLYYDKLIANIILPASGEKDSKNINKFLNTISNNDSRISKSFSNKIKGGYIDIFNVKIDQDEDKDEYQEDSKENAEYLYDIILTKIYDSNDLGDLLLEYVKESGKKPPIKELYKNIKIGIFWDGIKQARHKELYLEKLQYNEILKEDYDRVQELKKSKEGKEELTPSEKCDLLLEYVTEFKTKTPSKEKLYKDVKIGSFWGHIKHCSRHKELYLEKLQHNEILKEDYDRVQDLKKSKEGKKLTPSEKCDLLLEYVTESGKKPSKEELYKHVKIESFWGTIKQGHHHKQLYIEKLQHNEILKKDYDRLQELKKRKEGKELTPYEKCDLLLEYVKESGKKPSKEELYKGVKIGTFWHTIKQRSHKLYLEKLQHNEILKEDYVRVQELKKSKYNS
jgi:superfamily II DNA or RNA helicase